MPPEPDPSPPAPVVPALKLPKIGCGRVAVEERNDRTVVVGFVGSRDDLAKVMQAAAKSNAQAQVELRPWAPVRGADDPGEAVGRVGQANDLIAQACLPGIGKPWHSTCRWPPFRDTCTSLTSRPTVVWVNLVQSDSLTLFTLPARSKMRFGDGRDGRPRFTVSPPFGNEMIVAIASKCPLFAKDRPLVETEREFLTALRKAIIARPDPSLPERVVTASFVVLETTGGD